MIRWHVRYWTIF